MFRRVLALALVAAFAVPTAAFAQEEAEEDDGNPMMAISSWKCDFANVGDVNDAWDTYGLPAAQQVVDSGLWSSAGVFYHVWADEWNVNYYMLGEDIATILEGWEQYVANLEDAPDSADITQWCKEHKDGFYQFGESTEGDDEEEGEGEG
jgi:hypothetical protein